MPELAELIQRRLDAGETLRGLAARTGDVVEHQTIDRWHKRKTTQFPRNAQTFMALADVLDVNLEQVVLAMAAQLGVPVRRLDGAASFVPSGADQALTDSQREALRQLIKAIIDVPAGRRRGRPLQSVGYDEEAAHIEEISRHLRPEDS